MSAWSWQKVNTDDNPRWAMQYGVQGIPTMLLIADGKVVHRQVGALPEPYLRDMVDEFLGAVEEASNGGSNGSSKRKRELTESWAIAKGGAFSHALFFATINSGCGYFLPRMLALNIKASTRLPSRRDAERARAHDRILRERRRSAGSITRSGMVISSAIAPQVSPAPKPTNTKLSPLRIRPWSQASQNAIGIEAVGSIPISINIDGEPFERQIQPARSRFDDARIGLMRHD